MSIESTALQLRLHKNPFRLPFPAGDYCWREIMVAVKSSSSDAATLPVVSFTTLFEDFPPEKCEIVVGFFKRVGVDHSIKTEYDVKDSFSNLTAGVLKVISIDRGKISCLVHVKAPILNAYGGMHGGAVAAVAERVAIACARSVVGRDKDIFLGELSISYLSAAPHNAELVADGSVIRSGRNLTVVAVNFQLKESGRLTFMTRGSQSALAYPVDPSQA